MTVMSHQSSEPHEIHRYRKTTRPCAQSRSDRATPPRTTAFGARFEEPGPKRREGTAATVEFPLGRYEVCSHCSCPVVRGKSASQRHGRKPHKSKTRLIKYIRPDPPPLGRACGCDVRTAMTEANADVLAAGTLPRVRFIAYADVDRGFLASKIFELQDVVSESTEPRTGVFFSMLPQRGMSPYHRRLVVSDSIEGVYLAIRAHR